VPGFGLFPRPFAVGARIQKPRRAENEEDRVMATIIPFLRNDDQVFDPKDVSAMATAFDDVCNALKLNDDSVSRETVAMRIIDLARGGLRNPTALRDRVLREAALVSRIGQNGEVVESNNV
jgi:hypothetical protein